jgi:hypothetical protein
MSKRALTQARNPFASCHAGPLRNPLEWLRTLVHPGRVRDLGLAALVVVVAAMGTTTPDPNRFWGALLLLTMLWLFCRRSTNRLTKVIAKTLQPWLLGMLIVGLAYLVATAWLPQAQWPWLFYVEKAAIWCELTLKKVLPESIVANIGLLVLLFSINVLHPTWKTWTGRLQKVISGTQSVAAVLAVVTSFTFFGAPQSAILVKAIAQEKYNRVKEESTAVAQLILAARISEGREAEAQTTKEFLNVVLAGVPDLQLPQETPDWARLAYAKELRTSVTNLDKQLRTSIRDRVFELLKYTSQGDAAGHMARIFDRSRLESMLGRKFTNEEIEDAKKRFETVLDEFAREGAKLTSHPLSTMLEAAGVPDLTQSIVEDLYKSEVSRLAKGISGPLAESLFSSSSVPADAIVGKVAALAARPVFDETALPREIRTPIFYRESIERAAERARELDAPGRGDIRGEGRSPVVRGR